ncbi:Puromycin-sensitive aminopeptidase [Thelohanellus kitauei]|uniref:Puromycin-sensitive aminopeptidase n=1 Tax=Thelohanellus kitauei TaxID=669202 RepID=A0A0C2MW85_THEKT|nr:Puromycin-sensitive aminopeptidase [Thelohanellus kitauei]
MDTYRASDNIEQGKFATELSPKVLETFETLFNIPYPLEKLGFLIYKLDLIGIPGFKAEGMEYWGLITFKTTTVLINPKLSLIWEMQRVSHFIVHELAHQVCIALLFSFSLTLLAFRLCNLFHTDCCHYLPTKH